MTLTLLTFCVMLALDTFTKLVWWGEHNSHHLVSKADADVADDVIKAHSEDNHAPRASPPPSALLSVIGFVPSEDYWLTSCGMWKGPTTAAPNFADAKATCTIDDAKLEVLGDDFKHALANVHTLIQNGSTPGYNVSKGLYVKSSMGTFKLKFRHVLFERISPDDGGGEDEDYNNLPKEFSIAHWLTYYNEAKKALEDMSAMHRANFIDAFDMPGHLINPRKYCKHLQGAIVQMHFTMTHWAIPAKNGVPACDTFVADIASVRVLIAPKPSLSSTPKKRKINRVDSLTPNISPCRSFITLNNDR